MTESRILLDPTGEHAPDRLPRAPRPAALDGLTIGLLDINKPRGDVFLDRLETQLVGRGLRVERFRKPTFTRVAPVDLRQAISERCHVVIEALAD